MKRVLVAILSLAGLFALETSQSGCSLIGLAVDAGQPADTVMVDPALDELEGKTLLITLRNGERFAARCGKVGSLPMELYGARYMRWEKLAQASASPLSLNDTLHVAWDNGKVTVGALQGFTRSAIVIQRPSVTSGLHKHRAQTVSIPVGRVDSLWTFGGKVWEGQMLQERLAEGVIPTMDALRVRRGEEAAWVLLDDVATLVEIRHPYTWLNSGAIADGIGLVAAMVFFASRR